MHARALRSVETLIEHEESLVLTPQVAAEFWNVATRPADRNGLGMSHNEARQELTRVEAFFSVLSESPEVYAEWKRLVGHYKVTGVQVHDARLVAAMRIYGVGRILTFNAGDFLRYRDIIDVLEPI